MKTICPYCNQEFPETPDEYLGMTLECPSCHRNFVCEKPKFCIECGAPNPANALQCSLCGKVFSPASETASASQASGNTSAPLHPADEESDYRRFVRDKIRTQTVNKKVSDEEKLRSAGDKSQSRTPKSKAMKLANWGGGLGLAGMLLSPLLGIPGIVLGIMAFCARTEKEKSGWGGSSVNNRALCAIIAGLLSLLVLVVRGGK